MSIVLEVTIHDPEGVGPQIVQDEVYEAIRNHGLEGKVRWIPSPPSAELKSMTVREFMETADSAACGECGADYSSSCHTCNPI